MYMYMLHVHVLQPSPRIIRWGGAAVFGLPRPGYPTKGVNVQFFTFICNNAAAITPRVIGGVPAGYCTVTPPRHQ